MDTDIRKYRLTFTERLLGTCPPKEVYEKYILSKAPVPDDEETLEELEVLDFETGIGGEKNSGLVTRFHRDTEGLYLVDYQCRGFLKEAGNVIKEALYNEKSKKPGIKNCRSKIDNFVFVFPRWIFLADKPDGVYPRPLRAQTAQGPRVSIAVSEFLEPGVSVDIKIDILPGCEIGWTAIEQILDYGKYRGMGQFRNGSFGRFTWERLENGNGKEQL